MDAFLLFVMLPLLGAGIYYVKENDFVQFMIGYIYANALNDFDKARSEYNEFLKRFPKHELSPSVKFEIDYLGKDINEIPALKHITSPS